MNGLKQAQNTRQTLGSRAAAVAGGRVRRGGHRGGWRATLLGAWRTLLPHAVLF